MKSGQSVRHPRWGLGTVEIDKSDTVLVRFDHGYESCVPEDLTVVESALDALDKAAWHSPIRVVTRAQAASISSINDAWGVFSLSQIALLPHQLWVCHKVLRELPARWLIADDVGLGKTIEAGLILRALIHRGLADRILIICPASLTPQWQARLGDMFDIRAGIYSRASDTGRYSFFETNRRVIASLQTIRLDRERANGERWLDHLLKAPPWDVVIVDEAHHLNSSEEHLTLGYKLVQRLVEADRVGSMFFFTGTPHRGANFGFLGLLRLLHEELFDPRKPIGPQLPLLKQAVIRNNKENVTDLKGQRLFLRPKVSAETYKYTPEEAEFYELLTDFIVTGKAYASTLAQQQGYAVMLVLIAMQKLASSSVAAIRRALQGRLKRIADRRAQLNKLERIKKILEEVGQLGSLTEAGEFDDAAKLEERIAELSADLQLMEDEEPRLRVLLAAAERVTRESKIARVLEIVEQKYPDLNVLFFTEYKATQSLLMSELIARHGSNGCVTFINGDNRAEGVVDIAGNTVSVTQDRKVAAAHFNRSEVRFLVSTEAGGEGIDLHEACRVLIHIDLPWNPMRLHQRVGRLNRYGQQTQIPVEVVSIRNPDTVEARIWAKLEGKILEIQRALSEVMEEPEDLMQLVLGMTNQGMFQNLFAGAPAGDEDRLNSWFNSTTASFGGRDVVDFVKSLAGSCEKFDFQQMSDKLPKVDLPSLKPFFVSMLKLNGRMVQEDAEGGIEFICPDAWKQASRAVRERYSGMHFSRKVRHLESTEKILAVGNAALEQALGQAKAHEAFMASLPRQTLKNPLVIYRITDAVTGEKRSISSVIAGVVLAAQQETSALLKDWEVLQLLNSLASASGFTADESPAATESATVNAGVDSARRLIEEQLATFDLPFRKPTLELFACLWPR
jgi:ERCC4-related helicase